MLKQIFRESFPTSKLFELLEKICLKTDKYYLVDSNAYKKLLFHNLFESLCNELQDYYFVSKHFYIQRKMTFNSFTNIVRQICKCNNVMFTSQIKYNESKYNINYYIYF
jgi:hypothetical protein